MNNKKIFTVSASVALVAATAVATVETSSSVDASADAKVNPEQEEAIKKAVNSSKNNRVKQTVDAIYKAFSADVDLRGLSSVKTQDGQKVAIMWFLPDGAYGDAATCHAMACHCYFDCYSDDACDGLCYGDGYSDYGC